MGTQKIISTAGALLLISSFILGCSENATEAKKPSAEPAKGTMPTVNIAQEPEKPAPVEQPTTKPEDPAKTPSEEPLAEATPPSSPAAEPISKGEQVYKSGCFACHATGVAGAPKFGDAALWKDRIAKGKDELVKNAIAGYTGTAGVMPPKGGFAHLSDEDIAAAVEYMMQAGQ